MTKFFVYPYHYSCDNAIMLKDALGGQRIKLQNSNYQHKKDHVIVNWGHSKCPYKERVINHPHAVALAVDKGISFEIMRCEGIPCVPYTTSKEVAKRWVGDKKLVVGRSELKGNNGSGIFFLNEVDKDAKLFTQFIPNKEEFRVNVYRGKPITIRRKILKKGHQPNKVRSGPNGYYFELCQDISGEQRKALNELANKVVKAHSLDFGGVDIIISEDNKMYVLEVNTAPELQGFAINRLAEYIKQDYANA